MTPAWAAGTRITMCSTSWSGRFLSVWNVPSTRGLRAKTNENADLTPALTSKSCSMMGSASIANRTQGNRVMVRHAARISAMRDRNFYKTALVKIATLTPGRRSMARSAAQISATLGRSWSRTVLASNAHLLPEPKVKMESSVAPIPATTGKSS